MVVVVVPVPSTVWQRHKSALQNVLITIHASTGGELLKLTGLGSNDNF